MAAGATVSGITIGDIAHIAKKGHEVAWIAYKDAVDGGLPIKRSKHVYIERVRDEVEFFASFGF